MALLLGYDVGSSSIKATLLDAATGGAVASATSPDRELDIVAENPGWAEQHPQTWWDNVIEATRRIRAEAQFDAGDVRAIGISYQMHGLVAVDKEQNVLRPAIIWCDSRAVEIGRKAAADIGERKCLERLLNLPGNFTASKLKWVMDNEPEVYSKIYKVMLPGDYIAMKMTGEICTTPSGLSEGIMWDFADEGKAGFVLDNYGVSGDLIAETVPTFSVQGELSKAAAEELGLKTGTEVTYRGGDQPNNAFSLAVLEPGEAAVTAGTSGVVYGVTDKKNYDKLSRLNTFVHVNHSSESPRYGVLLCVNGTGILNSWLKHNVGVSNVGGLSYEQMNVLAAEAPAGADGLILLPYGNGAERTLENNDIGASVHNWHFNVHDRRHLLRAAQEGIVFALNYGLDIMRDMGIEMKMCKAGHANMFLSEIFRETFATVTGAEVELYNTDGSQGAARAAGVGAGIYKSFDEAFVGLETVCKARPDESKVSMYGEIYRGWKEKLESVL